MYTAHALTAMFARKLLITCILGACFFLESAAIADFTVRSDFEGGSVRLLSVDQNNRVIRFMPGGVAERGWICWWAMKLEGLEPGKALTFELSPSDVLTRNEGKLTSKPLAAGWCMPDRAALSTDGSTWFTSNPGARSTGMIRYEVVPTSESLWIAWGPMFTLKEANAIIENTVRQVPNSQRFELARTRENRPVPAWTSRKDESQERPGVWIQARQHAWECGSSWVARGLMEWLSQRNESASWLIDNTEIVIVPIMDVDNVTTGNGGKEADPQDHNRDWFDQSIYPEVQAAQKSLRRWSEQGRLDFFIDLHNPGPNDKQPFFFLGPNELLSDLGRDNRSLFLSIAHRHIHDPLPVQENPRITGPTYHPLWQRISAQWVNAHGNSHTLASCLETSWNTPHSNTEGYRKVGAQLGETIVEFLKRRQRTPK